MPPIFRAIIFSPAASLPSGLLLFAIYGPSKGYVNSIFLLIATLMFAFLGALIVGVPFHIFMDNRNKTDRLTYGLGGFFIPLLLIALGPISSLDWQELVELNNIAIALLFSINGAAVALAFREIVYKT